MSTIVIPADDSEIDAFLVALLPSTDLPTRADMARAGLVAPSWPNPWGLGATSAQLLDIDRALDRRGIRRPTGEIGLGWAGPTLLAGGSADQINRWIPGILDGSATWCQLFSEPEAGSDLAAIRSTAVVDGDEFVLNGQKIWSTWADRADFGILLARTSTDTVPTGHSPTGNVAAGGRPQDGISYFVLDMRLPGIEVRPIIEMTGGNHFNEVFFTDVRIPAGHLVGTLNKGWALAKVTLGNERASLSEGGVIWGLGPTSAEFFDDMRAAEDPIKSRLADPIVRQEVAAAFTGAKILEILSGRIQSMVEAGIDPSVFASIRKALADVHGQRITTLRRSLDGADAMLGSSGPSLADDDPWMWAFLFSPALTIGGGTAQVQRNIIGERILGLPREPNRH